jgi:CRISPR system Cascade subunit CasA
MSEPTAISQPISLNLWRDPWISVIQPNGQMHKLSIGACLAEAHTLAALQDAAPLVVAGTHRLLVAILQAIYVPDSLDDIADVLRAGQFAQGKLDDFATQHAERFELFHPTAPFLQTGDVPLGNNGEKPKSVAYLFPELPSGTNRTLFHHTTDAHHRLCPVCCARGVVTIPSFAMSGGSGYSPSINGDPPIYLFPGSTSLFIALALSLTTPEYQPASAVPSRSQAAIWNTEPIVQLKREVAAVGYIESLVFPSRRMRLFPELEQGYCTLCGNFSEVGIRHMLYEMGHRRSKDAPVWDDPFVAFRIPTGKRANESAGLMPVRLQPGKALWREYTTLLLDERDEMFRPRIVRQMAQLYTTDALSDTQLVRFRCIGIYNPSGKAIVHEWLDEALEAPPDLLNDALGSELIAQALDQARQIEQTVRFTFDQHFRPLRAQGKKIDNKMVRFRTLRDRMLAIFWQQLAGDFRQFTRDAADPFARDDAIIFWINRVIAVGEQTFNQTADQVGNRADALRARVLAQDACWGRLRAKRKGWIGE